MIALRSSESMKSNNVVITSKIDWTKNIFSRSRLCVPRVDSGIVFMPDFPLVWRDIYSHVIYELYGALPKLRMIERYYMKFCVMCFWIFGKFDNNETKGHWKNL